MKLPLAVWGNRPGPGANSGAASDVTSGRLLRNTLVNGFANASNALVTLALTPYLLHTLGAEQYGVWLLALSLTFSSGYVALADLGLPEASVRFIAEARATGSAQTINEIASTTTAVFVLLGLISAVAVVAIAPVLVGFFGVSDPLEATAKLLFAVVGIGILIEVPTMAPLAVIEGTQRYGWLRILDVGGRLAWAVLVVSALLSGHGVLALAVALLVVTVVKAVAALAVSFRVQPGLGIRLGLVSRRMLRRIVTFGSKLTVLRGLSVIYAQMDRAIIGVALGAVAIAKYEIAFRLQSVAILVMVMASSSVLPAAAYNAGRGDEQKQRELYLRGTKYAVALVVPPTLATIIFARQLILSWVGDGYVAMTTPARLFLVYPLLGCLQQVGIAMLLGLGRVRRVLVLQAIAVAINLVLSIVLVKFLGIKGVILGTLIGNTIVWLPYTRYLLDTFAVSVQTWFRRIVFPNLPSTAAQVIVGLFVLRWVGSLDSLWAVLGAWGFTCFVSLGVFAATGLDEDERRHLWARVRSG